MKALLDGLLPRLFPGLKEGQHFQCVPHEGKSDLDRSISRKLKAWRIHGDRFVVVRDNDNAECTEVKVRIQTECRHCGRPDTLIRLVCQELESWYLGDLSALASAFDDASLNSPGLRKRFAQPDSWQKPSTEVQRLVKNFQKIRGARKMADHLNGARNQSASFNAFLAGMRRVLAEMGYCTS